MLPFYDDASDTHATRAITLPDDGVILIEGVFLQRPEWRAFLDDVVYLDCPRDIRFARESLAAQQNLAKFQSRYWPAEDYYLATVAPEKLADMVVKSDASI